MGDNVLNDTGAVTVNGGTLRVLNSVGGAETVSAFGGTGGTVDLDNGSLTVGQTVAGTYAGVLVGGGTFTKDGAETLTLTGANTHTGGTIISAGTLQIGDGGTSGSVAGDIVNNAELVFNRSNDVTYAGVISGSGATVSSARA